MKFGPCYGGLLGSLGASYRRHFFSQDYGGGDTCWRYGCNAQWPDSPPITDYAPYIQAEENHRG